VSGLNFYEVLNVKTNATEKEIKKAYRLLAKKYHPDTYSGDKTFAQKKMQEINIAYDTLSDFRMRSSYDEKIGVNVKKSGEPQVRKTSNPEAYYRYGAYDKPGVNYNVKYRPNTEKIKYDSGGYAESNYYTYQRDDEDYYEKRDLNYKKAKIKELLSGKNLIYTLITACLVIGFFSFAIYKAAESLNELFASARENYEKINASKEASERENEENREALNESFSSFLEEMQNKERELIDNYNKRKTETGLKENNSVTENADNEVESDIKSAEDINKFLEELGINDDKTKQEFWELIEAFNKN